MISGAVRRRVSMADTSHDSTEKRKRLNERLRVAFIAGAEEDSRRRLGRGLTRNELERVLRRYAGDVGNAGRLDDHAPRASR
jgi:hypothetical protein